jgi:hypothetical protein
MQRLKNYSNRRDKRPSSTSFRHCKKENTSRKSTNGNKHEMYLMGSRKAIKLLGSVPVHQSGRLSSGLNLQRAAALIRCCPFRRTMPGAHPARKQAGQSLRTF